MALAAYLRALPAVPAGAVVWSGGVITDLPSKRHHTPKPSCDSCSGTGTEFVLKKNKNKIGAYMELEIDGLSGQSSPGEQRKHGSGRVLNFEQDNS